MGWSRGTMRRGLSAAAAGLLILSFFSSVPGTAAPSQQEGLWQKSEANLSASRTARRVDVDAKRFGAYTLDHAGMRALLPPPAAAPVVVWLPVPDGGFERFSLVDSPVMEAGLAARHPEIKTFSGKGIDDPTATIRADLTPLGFHASVRSERGSWYVDPYYNQDQSVYATYFGRDLSNVDGSDAFVEREDVEEAVADLAGDIADIPVGASVTLRTYRLALVTDPSYATYFGAENVTAAKVTLMNRVNQVYEDETAIRLVLINDTDKTNLNTPELATGTNGPCGAAACFTAAQLAGCGGGTLNRNRIVLGQLIGASNYDIGHLGLGVNGGGVAGLGVVGGDSKARGCTGLPTPVGDFYAVDYVAHEMGHQFGGNHTFNGTQLNCSGGNRNAANSVEPGSGSSIMAYAGICRQDDLQPHSDPYWSQRSFTEITTYVGSTRPAINEVQNVSLRGFDTDGDSFALFFNGNFTAPIVRGTNYTTAGIKAALEASAGWPAGATVTVAPFGGTGTLTDEGFQVSFNGGAVAAVNQANLGLTNTVGVTGFVGETAKGGPIDNGGNVVQVTANHAPVVTVPAAVTIPLRTPFTLTGSATDSDGDTVTYMWEQNDRGGISGGSTAGTTLVSNTKASGPLFRQFGTAAVVSPADTLKYYSPGENAVSTNPTRVFPDMAQVAADNTNAKTGVCPIAPPSPAPVPAAILDCYSEFLPTADWVGFTNDRVMHFRLTARDGHPGAGGVSNAEVAVTLAPTAGPFLVTSLGSAGAIEGGAPQAISWDVAGTDQAPVNATNVRITLSADGGATFPHVLASSTANDGGETVTIPNIATQHARIRIEAVGNIFFDLNDADITIHAAPVVANDAPAGGAVVQYSDALSPTVTVTATDADTAGAELTAVASGLPSGLALTSAGVATWTVTGATNAAPGDYPVVVTVTDNTAISRTTAFTIHVAAEEAATTYAGDMLVFAPSGNPITTVHLRATVRDSADGAAGNVTNATVTFKEGSTTLCTATVGLLGAAATEGSAHCAATLPVGAHTISVETGGYYTGGASVAVGVASADGSFITGGGFVTPTRPTGAYPADPGTKTFFAFLARYAQGSDNPSGQAAILFQSGNRSFVLSANDVDSLGVITSGGTDKADMRSTATLVDVTDLLHPVVVGSGLTLQMTATDRGQPGRDDSLAITLWDGDTLLFSSDWTGARTQEIALGGGNLIVH
ncbi:MAG TPA: M12 family metallo-peptidase [Candidatus Limnocylindrales bacterium]|nr:M12 family metallo-peptidase [Candidatus Limnocylindrales bacterium]